MATKILNLSALYLIICSLIQLHGQQKKFNYDKNFEKFIPEDVENQHEEVYNLIELSNYFTDNYKVDSFKSFTFYSVNDSIINNSYYNTFNNTGLLTSHYSYTYEYWMNNLNTYQTKINYEYKKEKLVGLTKTVNYVKPAFDVDTQYTTHTSILYDAHNNSTRSVELIPNKMNTFDSTIIEKYYSQEGELTKLLNATITLTSSEAITKIYDEEGRLKEELFVNLRDGSKQIFQYLYQYLNQDDTLHIKKHLIDKDTFLVNHEIIYDTLANGKVIINKGNRHNKKVYYYNNNKERISGYYYSPVNGQIRLSHKDTLIYLNRKLTHYYICEFNKPYYEYLEKYEYNKDGAKISYGKYFRNPQNNQLEPTYKEYYYIKPQNTANTRNESFYFSCYPNPTKNTVNINTTLANQSISLYLFDLKGTLLLSDQILGTSHQIDLSNLKPGIYILCLEGKTGPSHFLKNLKLKIE